MKHFIYTLLLTGFATCFFACQERIDIDTDASEPQIVIYGNITDRLEKQLVKISSSSPYFDDVSNKSISNAKVVLSNSLGEKFTLLEDAAAKGNYFTTTPMAGQAGLTYTLNVDVDFDGDGIIDRYEASSTMQVIPPLDSIQVRPFSGSTGTAIFFVWLYAPNPTSLTHFVAKFKVNDTLVSKLKHYSLFTNERVVTSYVDDIMIYNFLDLSEKADQNEDERDNYLYCSSGDTITLVLSSVEKSYFKFVEQAQKELQGGNPFFGGPPSNIQHNIKGGGLGYFSATGSVETKTIVP